jgi:hypothetical protein
MKAKKIAINIAFRQDKGIQKGWFSRNTLCLQLGAVRTQMFNPGDRVLASLCIFE